MLRSQRPRISLRHRASPRIRTFVSVTSLPQRPSATSLLPPRIPAVSCKLSTVNVPFLSPFVATLRRNCDKASKSASVSPLFATLLPRAQSRGTDTAQLVENKGALSPLFATLTSFVTRKPFICHSYRKHRGVGACGSGSLLATRHPSLATISFRITSLADPHHLDPFKSHLSKKGGGGWPKLLLLLSFLILCSPSVFAQKLSHATEPRSPQIEVYQSSEDAHETLQQKPPLTFGATRLPNLTITVNDAVKYQRIDGFGASLTDSSAWLLWNKLTATQRKETLEMLFSREKGAGLSVLRQPMGASDFALTAYSYDEVPLGDDDPGLQHFSIDHDRASILPILREAQAINPHLKIIATPWSPPGWMKTSGSLIRGSLKPSAYPALAKYFVRFVQEYEKAGIPIDAVTMQNEPLYVPGDYPGMEMTAYEQTEFLAKHLGPAFRDARLKTKILVFDHNWDLIEYPLQVLSDAAAASFASGIATHCYGGVPAVQKELHERFPDKPIWMTECSGGEWQTGKILQQQVRLIIETTRNWAQAVVLWNLALNQLHQPYLGGCTTCRGIVTVNDSTQPSQVTPTVDYTALAHVSKFVVPGAYRVDSTDFGQGSLEDVAFLNPDGSLVLLVMNSGNAALSFNVGWAGKFASYKLAGGAVATFRWNAPAGSR